MTQGRNIPSGLTEEVREKALAAIREWLRTDQAQMELRAVMENVQEAIRRLQRARQVTRQQLYEPMTI